MKDEERQVLSALCSVRRELQVKGKRKKVKRKSDGEFLDRVFLFSAFHFQL
jgi:hypothetical protein